MITAWRLVLVCGSHTCSCVKFHSPECSDVSNGELYTHEYSYWIWQGALCEWIGKPWKFVFFSQLLTLPSARGDKPGRHRRSCTRVELSFVESQKVGSFGRDLGGSEDYAFQREECRSNVLF
ncbi:hypothetical protein BaRGS_00004291 [Batillaria attramentaria]|uniref:Secreted protein n=1 Tax=Batillaria attramentaria TaxID=370345 RepID=A0ABD0LXQ3_9CAEN